MPQQRDYQQDMKEDYPVGILLGEPKRVRNKANKLEKQLDKNTNKSAIIGGALGAGVFGLGAYLGAKELHLSDDPLSGLVLPTAVGAVAGLGIGSVTGSTLTRYINYKKLANKNDVKTKLVGYDAIDEAGQVATLLGKDKEEIKQYQALNSKLKIAGILGGGGTTGLTTAATLALGPVPYLVGTTVKYPLYNFMRDTSKNYMYNTLLSDKLKQESVT